MKFRNVGWSDPALLYDEEKDLSRFTDGRFAFSRERADWELLKKSGRTKGSDRHTTRALPLQDTVPFDPRAED